MLVVSVVASVVLSLLGPPLTVTGAASFEVLVPPPADGSTRARLGRLTLPHGVVETPQFMPVGTNATVKALHPDEVEAAGATILLANTYHLYLRPGHERIERLGGLHGFMGWDRPILTDSGGFQVVSLGDLRVIDDDGVTFKSHLDGSIHRFTPEHSIAVQQALGPDVAVAFDQPVFPSSPRAIVEDAMRRTHRWAERSLAAHTRHGPGAVRDRPGRPRPRAARRVRAVHRRRCRSTASTSAASPATRRPRSATLTLDDTIPHLDGDPRPRYLMGLGSPLDLLDAVHRGIDLFDSVLPARVARNGQLWVPGGRLNLRNEQFRDDPRPVQDDCPCPLCTRFSTGLSEPSVPGEGDARVPARDLSQPHLHPRLHGQDPGCAARRNLPRRARRAALPRRPDEWR